MNFIFRILLIGISSFYIMDFMPWWTIIIIPFILGVIFDDNLFSHFLSSFIGTGVAWLFLMLNFDLETQSLSGNLYLLNLFAQTLSLFSGYL